ncbi:hemolysin family protein [Paenibacillus sp. 481]|uniref:hemolysin family protein n=1 Tax=Paenibacillus sp. 481 TaxID=2835869 RepID=UPI001E554D58|nr:hemolysin family protein [Paenibacillus sp. 481]UHA72695.1 HlyC/CorC family transporter [Paenibacillus sp. 481]
MDTYPLLNLTLVAILILLTGFFVATEFAIIKIRASRVDQLVLEGRSNALAVKEVTSNLDGYLSACQLGITITALGLGSLGEPTVEALLHPVFDKWGLPIQYAGIMSYVIAMVSMTFLHVVVGELAPKTVAIQKSEKVSLLFAKPIIFFYKMMYPFIWLLNGSANRLLRLFGMKPAKEHEDAHSEEELQIILSESYESGKINNTEYGYVSRIFAFDELLAKEIMVPRTDMVCLHANKSVDENIAIIKAEQYTRFPVIQESKDNVIGMVNTKHLFLKFNDLREVKLAEIMHPVLTVSEAMPIKTLLKKMQKERAHIAILVDEYGGTSGMISIEDILEEIVGEIRDEFDSDERPEMERIADQHYLVDGKVLLAEINDIFGTHIESEDLDTIGGWLYGQYPDSKKGSAYTVENIQFTIVEKEKHRIRKIEIKKPEVVEATGASEGLAAVEASAK